ncbi:response regulator transcription factor [Bradyrhizobium sp. ORS 111]|uniref:response regulator transcription factor n=1 Tax=Bradyrhizobium sp. ORS 111 TaxID=1685958 RepID=UPI00388D00E6
MISSTKTLITPTRRERELMLLIARGMQNKNIAHELSISENTVRAHIGNIMRKYRLHNRTQIAMIFALDASPASVRRDLAQASNRSNPALRPVPAATIALPSVTGALAETAPE